MVARPQVGIVVERMKLDDLPAVQEIERHSFTTPWPPHAYRTELETNRLAHYIVARHGGEIVGFAGMWLMVDEAHITTFAVHRDWRRQGIGERLLIAMLELALGRGAHEATLEVRPSNIPARRLYEKYGFRPVGVRPRYYSDNNEDALIMTTEPLEGRPMRARLERLRSELAARTDDRPEAGHHRAGDGDHDDPPVAQGSEPSDTSAGSPDDSQDGGSGPFGPVRRRFGRRRP